MPRTAAVDGVGDALTSEEVCQLAGVTYRQLDHWVRVGYVPPPGTRTGKAGSGHGRRWARAEADRVQRMARLVREGLTVRAAAARAEMAAR